MILEFSTPPGLLGMAYRLYFEGILPRIAGLVSGDRAAYSYLPASVARFPDPAAFGRLMEEAGFAGVAWTRLTAGIAHLYRGEKREMTPVADALPSPGEVTRLLRAWGEGDASARDHLIPLIYDELRRQARSHLRRERPGHTLRPTDLVHETYLRLRAQNSGWDNRSSSSR
jgi:hypothetical protein